MADWRIQYWDSPLFISLLTAKETARVEIIRGLLDQYDRAGIQIVISSMVIAEVRRIPKAGARGPAPGNEENVKVVPYDAMYLERVRELFRSDQLDYRVLTPRIAELARDIGDEFPKLLPVDCVHAATALDAKVDVLFTWDGSGLQRRRPDALLRYDRRLGDDPPLRIMEPFVPSGKLFDPRPA